MNWKAMAKLRSVNTHFWKDSYVGGLSPNEKLLFLYFLTCPLSNIAGVYEIALREVAFDTGLKDAEITKAINRMAADGKILYQYGYVILVNHAKNQKLNPSMQMAVKAILAALPELVKQAYAQAVNRVHAGWVQDEPKLPAKDEKPAKDLATRQAEFRATIFTQENAVKYGKPMLQAFYNYWSEPNRSGTRMACELKPTWQLSGRLATWASKDMAKSTGNGGSGRIYRE